MLTIAIGVVMRIVAPAILLYVIMQHTNLDPAHYLNIVAGALQ